MGFYQMKKQTKRNCDEINLAIATNLLMGFYKSKMQIESNCDEINLAIATTLQIEFYQMKMQIKSYYDEINLAIATNLCMGFWHFKIQIKSYCDNPADEISQSETQMKNYYEAVVEFRSYCILTTDVLLTVIKLNNWKMKLVRISTK